MRFAALFAVVLGWERRNLASIGWRRPRWRSLAARRRCRARVIADRRRRRANVSPIH
jgi:hypothetical protein